MFTLGRSILDLLRRRSVQIGRTRITVMQSAKNRLRCDASCAGYLIHPSDFLIFWQKFRPGDYPFLPSWARFILKKPHGDHLIGKHADHKDALIEIALVQNQETF